MFTITGRLIHTGATQTISDRFRKRDIVIAFMDGQYEQECKLQVTQDRCEFIDQIPLGTEVTVDFNLKGRSYDKKDGSGKDWFTNVEAWRVKYEPQGTAPTTTAPQQGEEVPF